MIAGVVLLSSTHAAVYKKVDADGNVSFSDIPDKSAQIVNVAPLSTVPAMSPALINKTLNGDAAADVPAVDMSSYVLTINSPTADQTFNRAEDAFAASVTVKPELRAGDKLVLLVDGKPAAPTAKQDSASPTVHTNEMDRGGHQFEARIVSAKGKIITSKSVNFFVQQASARRR
jgi:hypothetical protein